MKNSAPERIRTSDQLPSEVSSIAGSRDAAATSDSITTSSSSRTAPEQPRFGATKVQPITRHSDGTAAARAALRIRRALRPLPFHMNGGLAA
jgi:hypothetical protein